MTARRRIQTAWGRRAAAVVAAAAVLAVAGCDPSGEPQSANTASPWGAASASVAGYRFPDNLCVALSWAAFDDIAAGGLRVQEKIRSTAGDVAQASCTAVLHGVNSHLLVVTAIAIHGSATDAGRFFDGGRVAAKREMGKVVDLPGMADGAYGYLHPQLGQTLAVLHMTLNLSMSVTTVNCTDLPVDVRGRLIEHAYTTLARLRQR